jgi:hypothetical protein
MTPSELWVTEVVEPVRGRKRTFVSFSKDEALSEARWMKFIHPDATVTIDGMMRMKIRLEGE